MIARFLAGLPWPSRVARPASRGWNAVKTTLQATVFWLLFLVAVPIALHAAAVAVGWESAAWPHPAVLVAGIALLVGASALNVVAARAIVTLGDGTPLPVDATRRLVVRGPYRVVRNPMAIAGIGQGVGVGLALGSPVVVAYALAGAVFWHVVVRPWEEADLLARFGDDYAVYQAAVRCWIPTRRAIAPPGSRLSP